MSDSEDSDFDFLPKRKVDSLYVKPEAKRVVPAPIKCGHCGHVYAGNWGSLCPECALLEKAVSSALPEAPQAPVPVTNGSRRVDSGKQTFGPYVPPDAAPPEQPVEREQTGIDKLGLPVAAVKALMRSNFSTLADLRARRYEIPAIRGVGAKSVDAINELLGGVEAPQSVQALEDKQTTISLVALPLVITIGKVAMLVAPDSMRLVDLDSIVGGADNAVELTQIFLESTPLDNAQPTRLHVMQGASYVAAVIEWATRRGIPVFGNAS